MTKFDNEEKEYRLVFPGHILPGTDEDEIVENLARVLNVTPEKAQRLVAGKRRYVKQIFSHEMAIRIRIQVLNIGVECELVAVDPVNISSKPKKVKEHHSPFPSPESLALEPVKHEQGSAQEKSHGETMAELQEHIHGNKDKGSESNSAVFEKLEEKTSIKIEDSGATISRRRRLAQFVGDNLGYYLPRFEKFQEHGHTHFVFSWHWPAFFVPFLWAIYRKLWVWALVIFVSSVFWPFTNILWALCANYIYYMHCQAKLKKYRKGFSSEQIDEKISDTGGTSTLALFVAILAILILMNGVYWTAKLSPVFSELNTNLERIEHAKPNLN